MDRRRFLTMGGVAAAAAVAAGGGTLAVEEYRMDTMARSGHSVGRHRPPGIETTTVVWRVPASQPVVAITFDDGPDPRYTPGILATLAERDIPATFFLQGNHVKRHPELARQVAELYPVGNHSYSHPDMSLATAGSARAELEKAHEVISTVTGHEPIAFRPPYGRFSGAVAMVAAGMGYDMVLWSDFINARQSVAENLRRVGPAVAPGAIVLGHDGGKLPNSTVVNLLPRLLDRLRDRGFSFVTVPELLENARPHTHRPQL